MGPAQRREVKGTMFLHARQYFLEQRGEALLRDAVARLPAADRAILDGLILAGGWYPIGTWNRFVDRTSDSPGFVHDTARYIARNDMNMLFKLILKMASAEAVLRRAGSIFSRYFAIGELAAEPHGDRRWRMSLTAPCAEDEGPNEAMCVQGVPGWLIEALHLSRATAPRIDKLRCRFHGAATCEYDVTW